MIYAILFTTISAITLCNAGRIQPILFSDKFDAETIKNLDLYTSACPDSFSSSSSDNCDPCCAGVRKLTYQAPFGAGAYLAKVSQKFSVYDVFSREACFRIFNVAKASGVIANLIGSNGLDVCGPVAVDAATAANDYASASGSDVGTLRWNNVQVQTAASTYEATINPANAEALISATRSFVLSANGLLILAEAARATASDTVSRTESKELVVVTLLMIEIANKIIEAASAGLSLGNLTNDLNDSIIAAIGISDALVTATTAYVDAAVPYGTYYVVSRSWSLNRPIFEILGNTVTAANSLYNCFNEYRAIYLTKSLNEISYINNKDGNYCASPCPGKPQSCLTLCNGFKRPSYFPKFEMGF